MARNSEHAAHEKSVTRSEADEIARAIATAAADQILARAAEADATGLPFNGELELEVKYGGYTYLLKIKLPTEQSSSWLIEVARKKSDDPNAKYQPIADFVYVARDRWLALVGLPQPLSFGGATIEKLKLTVSKGSVVPADISSLMSSSEPSEPSELSEKRAGASAA
jgi:hypothetical protein